MCMFCREASGSVKQGCKTLNKKKLSFLLTEARSDSLLLSSTSSSILNQCHRLQPHPYHHEPTSTSQRTFQRSKARASRTSTTRPVDQHPPGRSDPYRGARSALLWLLDQRTEVLESSCHPGLWCHGGRPGKISLTRIAHLRFHRAMLIPAR